MVSPHELPCWEGCSEWQSDMLSKIFSFGHRKTEKKPADPEWRKNVHTCLRPFPALEQDAIRILVFKDCDRKGKSLLFDSKSFIKNEETAQNTSKPTDDSNNHRRPQYPRPSHDAKMLGEMMFGSVAMKYKGSTVKVHMMRSPSRLLLTKVFTLKPRTSTTNVCSDNSEYLNTSSSSQLDGMLDSTSLSDSPKEETLSVGSMPSKPVDVPGSSPRIEPDEDSGFIQSLENTGLSTAGSISSLFTPSTSPCGSYHRRLHRSQVTSIDHSFVRKRNPEAADEVSPVMPRHPKIGVGIILSLGDNEQKARDLQGFFFSHFPLLEFHMHRLRLSIEKACAGKSGSFMNYVMKAVGTFRDNLNNLLSTPRLKEPVWLNMMTQSDQRKNLCETFKTQLTDCLRDYNNRETNFFLATVLTAVLTYHLAWVPTVMPASAMPSRAYLDKHSSQMLDILAQSHPYNPLWAQLGDLYGAIGQPLRVTRTVVVGRNAKLVERVLQILSYFIRCTEVSEHFPKRTEEVEEIVDNETKDENLENVAEEEILQSRTLEPSETGTKLNLPTKNGFHSFSGEELDKEILRQLCADKALPCPKCGMLITTCDCVLNGKIPKELKELVKNAMLNGQCSNFQKNLVSLPKGPSFQCYCMSHGNGSSCPSKGIRAKANGVITNGHHDPEDSENLISNNSPSVGPPDKLSTQDHDDTCCRDRVLNPETDSCISVESGSFTGSLCKGLQGVFHAGRQTWFGSCGRCGSADSGICHSPLNSPSNKCGVNFASLSVDDVLEEDFGPIQMPMPRVSEEVSERKAEDVHSDEDVCHDFNNFGRSLFAGTSETYKADFVLQGISTNTLLPSVKGDLKLSLHHSVLDDQISEAICIIADTDTWECKLVSQKAKKLSQKDVDPVQPVEVSNLVLAMLNSVAGLCQVGMSAEFCLMHLEDKLKEIYLKSKVISECVKDRSRMLSKHDLSQILGIDDSDIALLLAVASTHSPQAMAYVR